MPVMTLDERMVQGCLKNIPCTPCTRCGWEPENGLWPSLGGVAVRWISENLIFGEGDFFGKPFVPMPDQKLFLYRWYEFCAQCDQWRFKESLRFEATGGGKTQFVAAIVLLEFAGPPEIAPDSPNIAIAAASWEQADLCFGQAALMVGGRDGDVAEAPLCGEFDVYDTEIRFKGSRPGRIFRTASIAGTNEGGLPHLFVCDELHEWGEEGTKKARVHFVIGKSTNKRHLQNPNRGAGRILNISTAGFDRENSILGTMYERCKAILEDQSKDPRFLVNIYEARGGLDFDKREDRLVACQDASPAAGVIWDVNDRVNEWGKIPNHEWIRYYGNTWPDINEDSWLKEHPQAWDHLKGEWETDPENNPWILSVDMALKQDSVAVDRLEWIDDGHLGKVAVTAKIWAAKDYNGRLPHEEVWAYIRDQIHGLGFKGVVYDPRFFEVPARLLENDGIRVIEFNQSADMMAPAAGLSYKMILEGRIVHNGQHDLARHVKGAAAVPIERGGFVLKKGVSKGKIDGCIAMVMGVKTLHELPKAQKPQFAWG